MKQLLTYKIPRSAIPFAIVLAVVLGVALGRVLAAAYYSL